MAKRKAQLRVIDLSKTQPTDFGPGRHLTIQDDYMVSSYDLTDEEQAKWQVLQRPETTLNIRIRLTAELKAEIIERLNSLGIIWPDGRLVLLG